MKALVFVTHADCDKIWQSLEVAGHEVVIEQYDNRPHSRHIELVHKTIDVNPDFSVFIGAVEEHHFKPVPSPEILKLIRAQTPLVHMCNDAGDDPWWPMLELYDKKECFDVQVSIDGAKSPISDFRNGLVLLCPTNCRSFVPLPWEQRAYKMSMIGNFGHSYRGAMVQGLVSRGALHWQQGSQSVRPYEEYAKILCTSKIVFNHPMTGSSRFRHVKARVVETGFAGSCLFELRGSPAASWFTPGVDYIEYDENVDIVISLLNGTPESKLIQTAENLRKRVEAEHHPKIFWDKVLEKAGVSL